MKVMRPKTAWYYQPRICRDREWHQRCMFYTFRRMEAWHRPTTRRLLRVREARDGL